MGNYGYIEKNYTGVIQYTTIATTGFYDITAYGAQGGSAKNSFSSTTIYQGGKGALIEGEFYLSAGTVLKLVVGGQGGKGSGYSSSAGGGGGGGGGGSFVIETNNGSDAVNIPLLIGGGGGGAGSQKNGYAANAGDYGSDGGGRGGAGGTNGAPGIAGFYRLPSPFFSHYSGGGGGFSGGRGGTGYFAPRNGYAAGVVPISNNGYATLYSGGGVRNSRNAARYDNALGGFGGGGGGAAITGGGVKGGGGGGGGFGGGGGGGYTGFYGGGGGGGSLDTGNALVAKGGVGVGNGNINIQNRPTGVYGYLGFVRTATIATSGWYELTAYGAQGGGTSLATTGSIASGGAGAEVSGFFSFAAGTVLELVVGGAGNFGGAGRNTQGGQGGGGGGGGSFIIETNNGVSAVDTPLLIAGGGGGASSSHEGYGGVTGSTGGSGGQNGGAGGSNGNGGGSGFYHGGGGGGYSGGSGGTYATKTGESGGGKGTGFAGGAGYYFNSPFKIGRGGFGGGGGGSGIGFSGKNAEGGAGGGGGGYGGGGGGGYSSAIGAGGGGGSLDTGTTGTGNAGVHSGNGEILIKPVAAPINNFGYTGTIQAVTLLSSGWYDLTAFGAQGGGAANLQFPTLSTGGNGAEVGGFFSFAAGTVLDLVVGGAGKTGGFGGGGGGGGGGSFIVEVNNGTNPVDTVLMVAGGGGGGAAVFPGTTTGNGAAAAISPQGSAGGGGGGGAGGLNGGGGDSAAYFGGGGGGYAGGAGWAGASESGGSGSGRGGSYAGGSSSFGGSGGFGGGGGGAAGFGRYNGAGGGGGGYGGGGGGGIKSGYSAGAGGAGGVRDTGGTAIGRAGVQTGNGAISIEQVAAPIASYGYSGRVETITIVSSGEYELTAYGAQGGGTSLATTGSIASGGAGAEVSGHFSLAAGTVLELVVGGAGYFGGAGRNTQGGQGGGGGGGGSFIIETNNGVSAVDTALLIAGGGGGASSNHEGYGGVTGSTGGSGGQNGGAGGSNGNGGGSGFYHGGGGGGYSGGSGGTYATKTGYSGGGKGTGFAGGAGYYFNSPFKIGRGGFGGGGGGSGIRFSSKMNAEGGAGGGGGGYGGGGGGGYSSTTGAGGGGGGGSMDSGAYAYAKGGVRSGNGLVQIELLECFLSGTRIATPDGEVPVEQLRVGDMVSTLVGDRIVDRPLRWAGRRTIKVTHPDQAPVRIRAGAFGDKLPRRDLLVTGEHCLLIAGRLVPARMLVNGSSILLDRAITAYTFHHLELLTHAILLAENLAAESFLDTGNRRNFSGSAFSDLRPDFGVNAGHKSWQTHAAAPLAVDRATVEPIWRALAARGAAWPAAMPEADLTDDPDLHLLTETGAVIRPALVSGAGQNFVIPAGITQLRLRSRNFRPAETIGPFCDDRRRLGVLAGEISLWSGRGQRQSLATGQLPGWYAPEPCGKARWTNGDAVLRLPKGTAPMLLRIDILQAGPYALPIPAPARAAAA